jgi:hypothetical protein
MSHSEPVPTPVAAIAAQAPSTPKGTKKYAADGALDVVKHAWIPSARRPPPSRSVQPTSLEPAVAGRGPCDTPANLRARPRLTPSEIAVGLREVRSHHGRQPPHGGRPFTRTIHSAGVAELADALDSKSSDRKVVGVQVPPPVLVAARSKKLGTKSICPGCNRPSRPFARCVNGLSNFSTLDARATEPRERRAGEPHPQVFILLGKSPVLGVCGERATT